MEKNTDKNENFPLFILAKIYLIKTTISRTFWKGRRTPCLGGFGAALWSLDHPACQLLGTLRCQTDLEEQSEIREAAGGVAQQHRGRKVWGMPGAWGKTICHLSSG